MECLGNDFLMTPDVKRSLGRPACSPRPRNCAGSPIGRSIWQSFDVDIKLFEGTVHLFASPKRVPLWAKILNYGDPDHPTWPREKSLDCQTAPQTWSESAHDQRLYETAGFPVEPSFHRCKQTGNRFPIHLYQDVLFCPVFWVALYYTKPGLGLIVT